SENLDHACMFAKSDTGGLKMLSAFPHLFKPYVLENCSAEGLATHLFDIFNALIREESGGRAWLKAIKVGEDSKNFAYFEK
ncbi:MAG: 6-carboxytetrahydropterin synthase, partial [Opitutales bacterium]|nr:6-carboxytetrahydropterin synthase [Opitutales bacterium]